MSWSGGNSYFLKRKGRNWEQPLTPTSGPMRILLRIVVIYIWIGILQTLHVIWKLGEATGPLR